MKRMGFVHPLRLATTALALPGASCSTTISYIETSVTAAVPTTLVTSRLGSFSNKVKIGSLPAPTPMVLAVVK